MPAAVCLSPYEGIDQIKSWLVGGGREQLGIREREKSVHTIYLSAELAEEGESPDVFLNTHASLSVSGPRDGWCKPLGISSLTLLR